ncbi:hypothetical protein B0T21DRAFT_133296 [Apiosordaria backusii]|uniref:Uncharacterized protein n=1 Tax=Apiosordaria backusii TaxID=314023 RepID=A0AA40K1H9_9PEZI|nr:hypothetical protein B0T21DRAFT_133296 [Apiosordaria backusii]
MKTSILIQAFFFPLLEISAATGLKPPKAPFLTHLCSVNCTLGDAVLVGSGPRGIRVVIPILNGTFTGPRLRGTILPIGANWALLDPKYGLDIEKSFTADVRTTFKTYDGEFIQVSISGERQADDTQKRTLVRIGMETGSERYYWVNSLVGLGVVTRPTEEGREFELGVEFWQARL